MRHEDAALALWLATDPVSAHDRRCLDVALDVAPVPSSLRRRAGAALIALGERLAAEPGNRPARATRRRGLAGQAS